MSAHDEAREFLSLFKTDEPEQAQTVDEIIDAAGYVGEWHEANDGTLVFDVHYDYPGAGSGEAVYLYRDSSGLPEQIDITTYGKSLIDGGPCCPAVNAFDHEIPCNFPGYADNH